MALSLCGAKIDDSGKEIMERGNIQFPIGCYHDDLTSDPVPWHWHEELEAAVVTEGEAVIAVGSRRYLAKTGDGFFINTGILHACWSAGPSLCRLHSMVFHPRVVGGSFDSVYWQKYLQPLMENVSLESFLLRQTDAELWQKKAVSFIETAWESCAGEKPRCAVEFYICALLTYRDGAGAPVCTAGARGRAHEADAAVYPYALRRGGISGADCSGRVRQRK